MRVENVSTGEMVRIPRKLRKAMRKHGINIEGYWYGHLYGFELFIRQPEFNNVGWIAASKLRRLLKK